MNAKVLLGCGLGALTLVLLAGCQEVGDDSALADGERAAQRGKMLPENAPSANPQQDGAQQALQALLQIRQEQCQSGNQLACEDIGRFPGRSQKLAEAIQACRSGTSQACQAYKTMAEQVFTSYSESAAVMQNGRERMAQMEAWRGQMNANANASMAALKAQGAAGQAAHEARQESYAAMNNAWEAGQASQDRSHGRHIDSIYEGTTMDGGGVQTRIPYGQTGYTDGNGNVATVPQGSDGPYGWQEMNPTYAAPE